MRSMGYTKLFSSIIASTIWREDDKTRLVWITMLAMKNERHMVEASLPGLADMARVTITECEKAIKKLESKDGYSRNQDNGGRRIERVQGGWKILNGEYYRAQMSADDRREYQKNYHREYRKRGKISGEIGGIAGAQQAVVDGLAQISPEILSCPAENIM
jgi:hypothetical protein